jgi:hypothetical protein
MYPLIRWQSQSSAAAGFLRRPPERIVGRRIFCYFSLSLPKSLRHDGNHQGIERYSFNFCLGDCLTANNFTNKTSVEIGNDLRLSFAGS